jgi:hypothetical protein
MDGMTALDVCRLMRLHRFRLGHEALLQEDVEALFRREGVPFLREHILGPADRVDFLVDGRIAVELKIRAPKRRILRQLERYAAHDCVEALVLASVSAVGIPPQLVGKPVFVVPLGLTGL